MVDWMKQARGRAGWRLNRNRKNSAASRIEGNVEFPGELFRLERPARKMAPADFQRGNRALAVVGLDDDLFPGWIFFDIHFAKCDAACSQERFCAPAIGAPVGAVHG